MVTGIWYDDNDDNDDKLIVITALHGFVSEIIARILWYSQNVALSHAISFFDLILQGFYQRCYQDHVTHDQGQYQDQALQDHDRDRDHNYVKLLDEIKKQTLRKMSPCSFTGRVHFNNVVYSF